MVRSISTKKNKLQLRNKQKKSDRPLHQQQQRYNRKSMNFYDEIKKNELNSHE